MAEPRAVNHVYSSHDPTARVWSSVELAYYWILLRKVA